jgi:hypothetical protein
MHRLQLIEKSVRTRVVIEEEAGSQDEAPTGRALNETEASQRRLWSARGKLIALSVAIAAAGLTAAAVIRFSTPAQPETTTAQPQTLATLPLKPDAAKSIAVLPFKTLGIRDNDDYLKLGLADALITRLGNAFSKL